MLFNNYDEARDYALANDLPLWDTHRIIDRYYVGHLTVDMEDDPNSGDWDEIFIRDIRPHKGGRTERLSVRVRPDVKAILFTVAEQNSESVSDLIERFAVNEKDTTKVYYCSAGGHFWRWDWTPEKGGDYFPAYVTDEEAPEDFDERYCGCND